MTKLFTTLFLLSAFFSYGQNKQSTDKDKERINKVCDQFMQIFAEGKIENALQLLKQNTVMSSSAIDTLQVTIAEQMNNISTAYGKIVSPEFIKEGKIKDFIAKRFYLLRFEKYYLKFEFTLYNNGKHWTITNFNYSEDLMELLN